MSVIRKQKNPIDYIIGKFADAYELYLADIMNKLPNDIQLDPNAAYVTYVEGLCAQGKDELDSMCRALVRGRLPVKEAEQLQVALEASTGAGTGKTQSPYY